MLRVNAISKAYGAEPVLRNISFTLPPGQRVSLIGPNGAGKSTLLKIIAGYIRPDAGTIWLDPADHVAYLPQYPDNELGLSVRQALLRDNPAGRLLDRMDGLEIEMRRAEGKQLNTLLIQYARAREQFEHLDGYALEARIEAVVAGLELDAGGLESAVATLSGGNKTKLSLGRLLLSGATILLLDEPTNYLDLRALLWLERFVVESDWSYVIVSHDRRFLDRTICSVFELNDVDHTIREWPGNYSDYDEAKLQERQKQLEAYADQQAEIRRIKGDISRTKEQARGVEARTKSGLGADHQRRLAKKVAKKAKVRERRLERELSGTDAIGKPRDSWQLHLADLGHDPIQDDRTIVEMQDIHVWFGAHEVLRGVDLLIRGRDRLALLGSNGSGKSTLIRGITGAVPLQGTVRLGPSARIGLVSQETDELPLDRTVLEVFRSRIEMREDEARTYLHKFLFTGDASLQQVSSLSYGQRAKLALCMMVRSDANFLILDEPTSHMDMPALTAIENALAAYRGPMLVVSHDRYFLERVGITRFEVMEEGRLHAIESIETYEAALL